MIDRAGIVETADRDALERFFGTSFEGVTIVVDGLPAENGAAALTGGETIHLDAAVLEAERPARMRVLAHELTHVVQQRRGRVQPGAGGAPVVDRTLEAEAELAAALFCSPFGSARERAGFVQTMLSAEGDFACCAEAGVLQPVVEIGGRRFSFNDLWQAVQDNPVMKQKGVSTKERGKIKTKLKHWVEAPVSQSYFSPKKKGHRKQFGGVDELVRALIGRVRSTESKQIECDLAKRVDQSATIKAWLNVFITNLTTVHGEIVANKKKYWAIPDIKTSLENSDYDSFDDFTDQFDFGGSDAGRYAYFYSKAISGVKRSKSRSLTDALAHFARHKDTASYKIAAFLCDYAMVFRDFIPDDFIEYKIAFEDARDTHWNVNENSEWVRFARAHNVRLGAGPSATTMQVLRVAYYVLGLLNLHAGKGFVLTDEDKVTMRYICLALFAFWNRHANQKRAEIHTYHEVMVILKGYGVPIERNGVSLGEFEYPLPNEIPG